MRKGAGLLGLAIFVLMLLLSVSCASRKDDGIIKIAWLGDLNSPEGKSEYNGAKLLLDELNAKSNLGEKEIILLQANTRGEPKEAVETVRRLLKRDRVVAILGPASSSSAIPIIPLLEQAKTPALVTSASASRITMIDDKLNPYMFRLGFSELSQARLAASWAYEKLRSRNAVVIHVSRDESSKIARDSFAEQFAKLGGRVIDDPVIEPGQEDFQDECARILESGAGLLYISASPLLAMDMLTELWNAGFSGRTIVPESWLDFPFPEDMAIKNIYIVARGYINDPGLVDFRNRYFNKFSEDALSSAILGYDALLLVYHALEKLIESSSQITGDTLLKTILNMEIDGLSGPLKISESTHEPLDKNAIILKLDGDGITIVERYKALKEGR